MTFWQLWGLFFYVISLYVITFSLFGSEFQRYALSSLQQLLADHPPAPEGLDPDIGTARNKPTLQAYCLSPCI